MRMTARVPFDLDTLIVLIVTATFYAFLMAHAQSDILAHISMAQKAIDGTNSYPPNFGFYLLINTLGQAPHGIMSIEKASIFVLSAATAAKYGLSKRIIRETFKDIAWTHTCPRSASALLALCLLFAFAIADPYAALQLNKLYLGRIVPHVWHNSTTILVFPFAILLFYRQAEALFKSQKPSAKETASLLALVIGNAIIKPSFLLPYIPATLTLIASLYLAGKVTRKSLLVLMLPSMAAVLLMISQKYMIYSLQLGTAQEEASGLTVGFPFQVMSQWVPTWYLPISLLMSFAFPIAAVITYRRILQNKLFLYSLILTLCAVMISAFIIETGPRYAHGNFMWSSIICTYLLFLSTALYLAPKWFASKSLSFKDFSLVSLFAAHVASGLLYVGWIVITRTYS